MFSLPHFTVMAFSSNGEKTNIKKNATAITIYKPDFFKCSKHKNAYQFKSEKWKETLTQQQQSRYKSKEKAHTDEHT